LRATRPLRSKEGKLKPEDEPRGCKPTVPGSAFERLGQAAIERKTSMSVAAAEVLDGKLPCFEIVRREKPPAAD